MRKILAIWAREIRANFLSPVAYITMVVFLVMSSLTFLQALQNKIGAEEPLLSILFVSILFWLPILVTVISMRLFAEEKRSGYIETLMTAPVTEWQVVLGKYAGALTFLVIAVIPAVLNVFWLSHASPAIHGVDLGALLGGCLLLGLLLATCAAIGMLMSLLTQNQIVAAIFCFAAICVPFLLEPVLKLIPVVPDKVVQYLAVEQHVVTCTRGLVPLQVIVLYVTCTVGFVFASVRTLESRRWLG